MMLSASVIGGNKRTLDRLKRQRGSGSLPLKKRRVNLYQTPLAEDEPRRTFVPLKPEARKISCEDLKLVTPEPSSATTAAAVSVGCVSMITSGFCNKPCFKQSSYCKQHFLQQQQQQQQQLQQQQQGTSSGSGSGDKRFTGADGQIRCCATTTRGRPCAYVAVGGLGPLKYCHLHADYDTNPSPRRDATKRDSTSSSSTSSSSPPSAASTSSPPSTISPRASPTSSDIPLLSSVPTDKWKHQSVRIGLGPLTGRIGVVEKWGNGWVSCSVEGVGLHNRRAFELQLLMGSTGTTTKTNKKQPKSPSPSPPPMTPTTSKPPAAIKQVTPCSVADVSSIQVPEIRLPHDDDSKTLSFRLSERSSGAFRNPL